MVRFFSVGFIFLIKIDMETIRLLRLLVAKRKEQGRQPPAVLFRELQQAMTVELKMELNELHKQGVVRVTNAINDKVIELMK